MSLYIVLLVQILLAFSLDIEAKLYAWGVNDYGQLGHNVTYVRSPQPMATYDNVNIVQLQTSGTYHMATADNGDVYVSGNNWYGGLAFPPSQKRYVSYPIKNPVLANCKIFLGKRHGNAICENKFYGWGVQGGYVAVCSDGIYGKKIDSLTRYQITGDNVADVIAGSRFSYVLFKNGTIVVAGSGAHGVLGLGDTKDRVTFEKFDFFDSIPLLKIFPSHAEHLCALSQSYSLYCWGYNGVGQLGLGDTVSRSIPTLVSFFEDHHYVTQVCVGLDHTVALTASGKVFTWGLALHGALGNGRSDNATFSSPVEITILSDKNIVEITCGYNFNFARTGENNWYSWGAGSGGVLGTQSDQDINSPTLVSFLSIYKINQILTASTSRSVYGWFDPAAPTNITGPPMVNECLIPGVITCSENAHCVDTDRFALCACNSGYAGDPSNCQDINECLAPVCVNTATCTNLPGSFNCTCPSNLPIGDGKASGSGCRARPPVTTTSTTAKATTSSTSSSSSSSSSSFNTTTSSTTSSSTSSTSSSSSSSSSSSTTLSTTSSSSSGNITTIGTTTTTTGTTTTTTTTTTNGDTTGSATSVPVSTTTRTNYYQTLHGTKEELAIDHESESEEDNQLQDGAVRRNNGDKDRQIMIAVLVVFAVLVAIALIVVLAFFIKSRR